jgi:putative hydrolase of the HAD superfamily
MFGNSVRSDILPAIEAGFWGVHIPYPLTWAHEEAEPPRTSRRYVRLESIAEAPAWVESLRSSKA